MGAYASIDIDLQDLLATIATVGEQYPISNPDSIDGLDGRAVLLSRLTDLGWLTPTEVTAARDAFSKGDGQRLLGLISAAPSEQPADIYQRVLTVSQQRGISYREAKSVVEAELA